MRRRAGCGELALGIGVGVWIGLGRTDYEGIIVTIVSKHHFRSMNDGACEILVTRLYHFFGVYYVSNNPDPTLSLLDTHRHRLFIPQTTSSPSHRHLARHHVELARSAHRKRQQQ